MMCHKSDSDSILKCKNALLGGGVVIIPTDTVYGFSALCDDSKNTDERIRKIKGRDEKKPFIQLISTPEEIKKYTDDIIPEEILKHWPGPLTVIVNDSRNPGETTAFRCPGDDWLRKIIAGCGRTIYSTSVNRSGNPVLSKISAISSEFEGEVDLIVDDGDKVDAVPSTIVKISNGSYEVLRQGGLKIS